MSTESAPGPPRAPDAPDAPVRGFPYDMDVGGPAPGEALGGRQVALVDLLDRLLTGGAVLTGDVVLSIADVDLVHINLRAVIHSISPDHPGPW